MSERERGADGGGVAGGEGKVDGVDAPDPDPVPKNPELRLVTDALRPEGERSWLKEGEVATVAFENVDEAEGDERAPRGTESG